MSFPIHVKSSVSIDGANVDKPIVLYGPFAVLLGPNGSGKTHLLRGLKSALTPHSAGKKVRFLSAGRVGLFEQYRSDYDGHRDNSPLYENARFGSLDDAKRRHQYETLQGDFQTLALRADIQIKIRERLRKLFKRDLSIEWDGGNLKIQFVRTTGSSKSYSSAREASGLLHLTGILTALYDDEVGALLIDEPEVSLHPQLQAFLLREMLSVAGLPGAQGNKKIVLVATHSTEFLEIRTPDDLPGLVFCYDLDQDPVQISPSAGELKSTKLFALIARMGQEHKLAFFAKTPLLVEGPSDQIICSGLASKFALNLEAGGSQLLPVIGKGQFPTVVKLLRLLGKEPLVLSDADGLADGLDLVNGFLLNDTANALAIKAGFSSAVELSGGVFRAFCSLIDTRWPEISLLAERHTYWTTRDPDAELSKARRRAALSSILIAPDPELAGVAQDGAWVTIKHRLCALLDMLESQGCFILRRGTIESYYLQSKATVTSEKPSAAAQEAAGFGGTQASMLELAYEDVLRCLRKASATQQIVEAELLQDMVLAVAAPALGRIKRGAVTEQLNSLARSTVGTQADLFALSTNENRLAIGLKSQILEVSGFPLSIGADDDVVKVVPVALGLQKGPKLPPSSGAQ